MMPFRASFRRLTSRVMKQRKTAPGATQQVKYPLRWALGDSSASVLPSSEFRLLALLAERFARANRFWLCTGIRAAVPWRRSQPLGAR